MTVDRDLAVVRAPAIMMRLKWDAISWLDARGCSLQVIWPLYCWWRGHNGRSHRDFWKEKAYELWNIGAEEKAFMVRTARRGATNI